MAIRRVTRYITKQGLAQVLDDGVSAWTVTLWTNKEDAQTRPETSIIIEYDDGKEEPQVGLPAGSPVKTRERRVEGYAKQWPNGLGYDFTTDPLDEKIPAVLIVTEPIPEPTLVEAVEAFFNAIGGEATLQAKRDMANALDREKQKSTRSGGGIA